MIAKCYKPLYGFCTCLEDELEKDDCGLGLSPKYGAKLCQELGDRFYTYLVIYDGFCHEVVKVTQSNNQLYIERGEECTQRNYWPCGTQVKFDWTASGIKALKDKVEEYPECPEETFTGEIKNGNCTVTFKDGVAIKPVPNKYQIPDGCYENPVVTYKDGCIARIGDKVRSTLYQPMNSKPETCSRCNRSNCFCYTGS